MRRHRPMTDGDRVARLRRVLQRVMERLRPVVERVRAQYDADASHPYRGLYISPDEAAQLLDKTPPAAADEAAGVEAIARELPYWDYLEQRFSLEPFDGAILALAVAPELDSRFQRLYAFVQDDVTRRHLSVELALQLLCGDDESERLLRWRHLAPTSPLVRHGLLRITPDAGGAQAWAAQAIRLDDQLQRFWLGQPGIDARLAGLGIWHDAPPPDARPRLGAFEQSLALTAERALDEESRRGFILSLDARDERMHTATAIAIAGRLGIPLLEVPWRGLRADGAAAREHLEIAAREAELRGAALLLRGVESHEQDTFIDAALRDLTRFSGLSIVGCLEGWPREATVRPDLSVDVPLPPTDARRRQWEAELDRAGLALPDAQVAILANRFHLNEHQIDASVRSARYQLSRLRYERIADATAPDGPDDETWTELLGAARSQRGQSLNQLARKIDARARWEHLVLPEDTLTQLRELCRRVDRREKVLDEWGFGGHSTRGRGVHALFAGPSGTGKTMAAEVIANQLGLDLHRIDLSAVVSKYVGETEKNLERIFRLAVDVVLLFDEADALLGKRSEVRDAHDRYANIEISYLLQRMEEYDGLSILATNLRGNIDDAFLRRLAFQIQFPFPDEVLRRGLWQSVWPEDLPRGKDVNLDRLAATFTLSGGNIRNVVLGAAFLAPDEGPVTLEHILQSLRREYQKIGRTVTGDELREQLAAGKAAA